MQVNIINGDYEWSHFTVLHTQELLKEEFFKPSL